MKNVDLGLFFFNYAYECQIKKKFQEAINYYKKAIEIEPNFFGSYVNMGHILFLEKRYKEAIECYRKVIRIKPDCYEAYSQIGYNYSMIGEYEKGKVYLKKALLNRQYNQGLETTINSLINCIEMLDEDINIVLTWIQIASYLKTIHIKPYIYEAYINITNSLYQINEIEKANEFKQKAISFKTVNKKPNFQKEDQIRINQINKYIENFKNNSNCNHDYQNIINLQYPLKRIPDFMIIGSPRCGSTAFYEYLVRHPQILPTAIKEINFFNTNRFNKCIELYLANFPSVNGNYISGEASVEYLYSAEAPKRIVKLFPNIKLIVIVRNPVERAFSDYKHICKIHNIKQSFLDVIEEEALGKKNYHIIQKGLYVKFLEYWMKFFLKEQFFLIRSEDFFRNRDIVLNQVFRFLEINDYKSNYKSFSPKPHDSFSDDIRIKLSKFYQPYNKMLEDLLEKNLSYT